MSDDFSIRDLFVNIKDEFKRHDKWLNNLDDKMDNHVTHIEHRLTEIETTLKNFRWILGILFTLVVGIFGMMFIQLVT